jgi:hypothetical protein
VHGVDPLLDYPISAGYIGGTFSIFLHALAPLVAYTYNYNAAALVPETVLIMTSSLVSLLLLLGFSSHSLATKLLYTIEASAVL